MSHFKLLDFHFAAVVDHGDVPDERLGFWGQILGSDPAEALILLGLR